VAGVEEIFEHPEQIEIHKARLFAEQKGLVREHFLEWQQTFLQQLEPVVPLRAPLVQAAASEFALLETEELQLFRRRDVLPPINVVQPEGRAFNVIFDITPEEGLDAFQFGWKKAELQFFIKVFGHDLRIVVELKNHIPAVPDRRHAVITLFGQFPDPRTVLVRNVDEFERRAGKFQDAALNEAERTPRKLNQFNHVKLVALAKPEFKTRPGR